MASIIPFIAGICCTLLVLFAIRRLRPRDVAVALTYIGGVRIEGTRMHFDARRLELVFRRGKLLSYQDGVGNAAELLSREDPCSK